jgi:hypothetical protein
LHGGERAGSVSDVKDGPPISGLPEIGIMDGQVGQARLGWAAAEGMLCILDIRKPIPAIMNACDQGWSVAGAGLLLAKE